MPLSKLSDGYFFPAFSQKNLATEGFTMPFHLWVYYWKIPVDSPLWSHRESVPSLCLTVLPLPMTGTFACPFPCFLLAKPLTPFSCSLPQYLQSILWILVLSWRLRRKLWEYTCQMPWDCPLPPPVSCASMTVPRSSAVLQGRSLWAQILGLLLSTLWPWASR